MIELLNLLVEKVHENEALDNDFYNKWIEAPVSTKIICLFARNYNEFTSCFPGVLAQLIANTKQLSARVEYSKILYSELGNGQLEKAHPILFEKFCNDLLGHMCVPGALNMKDLEKQVPILDGTINLINGEKKLYSGDIFTAVGAQVALEAQAYNMICQLYEGARNYLHLWPNKSSFHESCEFFYAHIGAAEKDHKVEALAAANKIIQTDEELEKAIYGFKKHLELFSNFWKSLIN